MSQVRRRGESDGSRVAVTITHPMNEYGAMTVRVAETDAVRQLVEYEGGVHSALAALPAGTQIPLVMERIGTRGNAWRVTGL